MSRSDSWLPHALTVGTAATALYLGSFLGVATASAHVHVDADDPAPGQTSILTFQVPNESETGSPTTVFTVVLPEVASARTAVLPGWTATLDRTDNGAYRSVTWTAAAGGGIPPEQFGQFQINVALPETDTVTFPATQSYADGTVVHWDQEAAPGAPEPERPAPTLQLSGSGSSMPEGHHGAATPAPESAPPSVSATPEATEPALRADNIARALGGGALLVAAISIGIVLVRRGA